MNDLKDSLKQTLVGVKKYIDNNVNDINTNKADKSELFSGSYNDLSNKPEIPSIEGLATEELVNNLNNDVVENIDEINIELETKASTEFVNTSLDGLRLLQITKEDYDALETKDPSTLYIVI
jgi:hypothetical protein